MIFLSIDYGRAHLGFAIAAGPLAQPLKSLTNSPQIFNDINHLIELHRIDKVIVGLPESHMAKEVRNFTDKLSQKISVPIDFQDETLSSHEARTALLHKTPTARRVNEHAAAAAIILQNWLDSNTHMLT